MGRETAVELPRDAEGREIPLDTPEVFTADGTAVHIVAFEYTYRTRDAHGSWSVHPDGTSGRHTALRPRDVHLAPPDSWERLERDLTAFDNRQTYGPCHYFHEPGDDCMSCPARDDACADAVMRDVASRIGDLRGGGR